MEALHLSQAGEAHSRIEVHSAAAEGACTLQSVAHKRMQACTCERHTHLC